MRQPRLGDVRIDQSGTRKTQAAARKGAVKITINIDRDSLSMLQATAKETGTPYQRLLNAVLKEGLNGREIIQARVARLEQELKKVKRRLAA